MCTAVVPKIALSLCTVHVPSCDCTKATHIHEERLLTRACMFTLIQYNQALFSAKHCNYTVGLHTHMHRDYSARKSKNCLQAVHAVLAAISQQTL